MQVEKSADAMVGSSPVTNTAWDALLDVPKADPMLTEMMITVRRAANGLTTDQVISFINKCEFISLGCFCAPSYSLQLLGLKKNSFPFDWVRSSLDGIIHCLQAGDSKAAQEVRTFASFAELDTSIEQWDGGDPSRELFAPRRFFGQQLEVFPEGSPRKMQRLVARTQMQVFSIPATFNVALPLSVQCFGKSLEVKLPGSACPGHLVHLYFHEGALSATLSMFVGAQMMFIEHLPVKEVLAISQ
ncbi:unnamed protein product [Polarella glacialis]|uniref:Uncharacterized protein n=1 Tax=Polarella glacialis TaxID=89957 RepID=A0A813IED8_POLGL|nr:unnamed protein product [Polarella glacialis]